MTTVKNSLAARVKDTAERAQAGKQAVTPVHKPVRLTVDVDPNLYRRLMSWCTDIAPAVGRVKVQQVWVMREILLETLEDKEFQAKVIERLRRTLDDQDAAKGKAK